MKPASLLLFILAIPVMLAHPVAAPNAAALAAKADVVCTGEFVSVLVEGDRQIARYHVDRLIQGRLDDVDLVIELVNVVGTPPVSLTAGEYLLVFLTRHIDGTFRLVDSFTARMRVGRVITLPAAAPALESEFLNSLESAEADVALLAAKQLRYFPGGAAVSALRAQLGRSASEEMRGAAIESLVRLKDYAVLTDARQFAEQTQTEAGGILSAIADVADREAAAQLAPGMRSVNVGVRRATARALRFSAVPELAELLSNGLEDPDVEVRYSCAAGLAQWLDDPVAALVPAQEEFLRSEATSPGVLRNRLLVALRARGLIGPAEPKKRPNGFQLR